MKRNFFPKKIIFISILLSLYVQTGFSQNTFEILVDSSEYYTDITTQTGWSLKFLATNNRLIVLDYNNYRILFYERGTNFEDNKIIKIVGEFARVQDGKPFDPVNYNRLSPEFTGTIYQDTLWITNYPYGEILQFDLNGNYLGTLSGKYRIFDSDDSTLYAFNDRNIYRYNDQNQEFTYLKDLPGSVQTQSGQYEPNIKIGSNRLCIKRNDTLDVYNLKDYISDPSPAKIFSVTANHMYDFVIMKDKILWATNLYDGQFQYCDLNGNNIQSGDFGPFIGTYNYTGGKLYCETSDVLKIFDRELNELTSVKKHSFYIYLSFLGADSLNLYFYDNRKGGFSITPLDYSAGVFHYNSNHEISYAAWHHDFRIANKYKYLLSEWPPDSFKVYRFDTDEMSALSFKVQKVQGCDVAGDSIYTLSGQNLKIYSNDGSSQRSYTLSNLSESNLQNIDSTSQLKFAVNKDKIFIFYNDTLNILSHSGIFEKMYEFPLGTYGKYAYLFASDTHVMANCPLQSIEIASGAVAPFLPEHTPTYGYIYKNLYWYQAGTNKYALEHLTFTAIEDKYSDSPKGFQLYQNYPNPFNPATHIKFVLPRSSRVKIEIFNSLGQQVATLLQAKIPAGYHVVNFDGSRFASGLYFYTLQAGDYYQVKKMILLK